MLPVGGCWQQPVERDRWVVSVVLPAAVALTRHASTVRRASSAGQDLASCETGLRKAPARGLGVHPACTVGASDVLPLMSEAGAGWRWWCESGVGCWLEFCFRGQEGLASEEVIQAKLGFLV